MILSASGILLHQKKILLLKRSFDSHMYPGFWGCPGGRTEPNETAEENVIREVKEECNLDFYPSEVVKIGDWNGKKFYRFLGNWSGQIKLQEEEVIEFNWFTFEEAIELQLAFDYSEILEILKSRQLL